MYWADINNVRINEVKGGKTVYLFVDRIFKAVTLGLINELDLDDSEIKKVKIEMV